MKKLLVFLSLLVFGVGAANALPAKVANWGLAWSDEFNGTKLDTNSWTSDTGPVYNQEQEKYVDSCIEVSNGSLKIWSKSHITVPVRGVVYPSGRIDTHDKRIFTYGYFEAAIKGPVGVGKNGPGLWSAVWLLGNSIHHGVAWPTCGEMELYEQRTCGCVVGANAAQPVPAVAGDDEFIACCHYGNPDGSPNYNSCQHNYPSCLCGGYHKYAVLWDSLHVEYYFDDTLFWGTNYPGKVGNNTFTTPSILQSTNTVAFHAPFYWIINVAVGGAYQGQNIDQTIFPTHMDLDYVRVYQSTVPVVKNPREHITQQSFALVHPSSAQLKVYDLTGKLVADYTGKVRMMQAGDNALKALSSSQSSNVYVVRLYDNGRCQSQRFVTAK
jgi:beta-glucanase (GH16 family)